MFRKIVAIEPTHMTPKAEEALRSVAADVVLFRDVPETDREVAERIGDADAVLLSFTARISGDVIAQCPNVRYIGMCCSLYSPESANVDIAAAKKRGITVTGIRDYGDEGVAEYVVCELVRCLHGFGDERAWFGRPREITGLRVGVLGLGRSGGVIADALRFFGARVSYFARTRKEGAERERGYRWEELDELLENSQVVCCCLNRNTVLLHKHEFEVLGSHKILFNTGLSPAWDEEPFLEWLGGDNLCCCDSVGALGGSHLLENRNVRCMQATSGITEQCFERLSTKVLENIRCFLEKHG